MIYNQQKHAQPAGETMDILQLVPAFPIQIVKFDVRPYFMFPPKRFGKQLKKLMKSADPG
jgi:hypothetical protein